MKLLPETEFEKEFNPISFKEFLTKDKKSQNEIISINFEDSFKKNLTLLLLVLTRKPKRLHINIISPQATKCTPIKELLGSLRQQKFMLYISTHSSYETIEELFEVHTLELELLNKIVLVQGEHTKIPDFSWKEKLKSSLKDYQKTLKNPIIKEEIKAIIQRVEKQNYRKQKTLLYSKSVPRNLKESSYERIIELDFHNDLHLRIQELRQKLNEYNFPLDELEKFFPFIKESGFSHAVMSDDSLRRTFYFFINYHKNQEILKKLLFEKFQISLPQEKKFYGLGIDVKNSKITSKKLYYKSNTSFEELLNLSKQAKEKKLFEEFLKLNKNQISLLDICQRTKGNKHNLKFEFRVSQQILFPKQLLREIGSQSRDKITILAFELLENEKEKVNIYYSLT